MNRAQLAHLIRSAARLTGRTEILVVGSQGILASWDEDELPEDVTLSREADVAFFDDEDEHWSDRVDGAIGEGSDFDQRNGYYAQGVGFATAVLPQGWMERRVRFPSSSALPGTAWAPDPHDLALSKLVAMRDKDRRYVLSLIENGKLDVGTLMERVEDLPTDGVTRAAIMSWLRTAAPRR